MSEITFQGQLTYAIWDEDVLYVTGIWKDDPLAVLLSALGGEWVEACPSGAVGLPGWRFVMPRLAPAIRGARMADVTAQIERYRQALVEAQRRAALLLEEMT